MRDIIIQHTLLNRQFLHVKDRRVSLSVSLPLSLDCFILEIRCIVYVILGIFLVPVSLHQGIERNQNIDFFFPWFMFLRDFQGIDISFCIGG